MYINGGKVATLDVSIGKGSHDTILHMELRNVTLFNLFEGGRGVAGVGLRKLCQ